MTCDRIRMSKYKLSKFKYEEHSNDKGKVVLKRLHKWFLSGIQSYNDIKSRKYWKHIKMSCRRAKNGPLIMISHSLQRSISELQPIIITRHKLKKEIYGGQPSLPIQTAQELHEEDSIETN